MVRGRSKLDTGLWHHVAALLAYLALSLLYLRPTWQEFTTGIPPSPVDPVFNLYILKWGIHQIHLGLAGGQTDFWNAPFFFPTQQVITFSDHLVGPAAMAAAFTAVVPNPIAAFNLLFLGSFVLCGWSTYAVLRWSGLGGAAAFLGGVMYAFSAFRWDQMSHLQVLLAQWIPLTLWSWDRLLAQPGRRRAILFLFFYVLHVTGGSYLAYMIHFPLLAILLVRLPELRRREKPWSALRVLVPVVLAAGLVLLPIYLPYVRNSAERGFERTSSEIRTSGASLVSYVTPTASNLYAGDWSEPWRRWESSLFPGMLASALLVGGGVSGWRRHRRPPERPLSGGRRALLAGLAAAAAGGWLLGELRTWARFAPGVVSAPSVSSQVDTVLIAAGLAALLLRRRWGGNWPLSWEGMSPWERGLLAAGALCFLLSFPQIYLPLRGVVPGLGGMRVPARFYAFLSFTLACFAAGTLDRLLARLDVRRRRAAVAACAAFLLLEVAPKPVSWVPLPREEDLPPVYGWLADQDGVEAILELPLLNPETEVLYMYYGTRHWKPLVNGYSGYIPRQYTALQEICCWPAPKPAALEQLRLMGVTHLLVPWKALGQRRKRAPFHQLVADGQIALEEAVGRYRVYRILVKAEP
jgi:hypothetical protein